MKIVITGSSKGIGLGLAKNFLENGHDVLINGRNEERLERTFLDLSKKYPGRVIKYLGDVTNFDTITSLSVYAKEIFGIINIWINNAGIDQDRLAFYALDSHETEKVMDINMKGVIFGTTAAYNVMKGQHGYIYNMEGYGSNNAMTKGMSIYGMTKRAVTYFTQSANKEVDDVHIFLLSPGMVKTSFLMNSLPKEAEERKRVIKIYNILVDSVEDVTKFLVEEMIKNKKKEKIAWLTRRKVMLRFLMQPFNKRTIMEEN